MLLTVAKVASKVITRSPGGGAGPEAGHRRLLGGEHAAAKRIGAGAIALATVFGIVDRAFGIVSVEDYTNVRAAAMSNLKLAQTIPEEIVVARAVAHYKGITAANHWDVCANPSKLPLVGGLLPGKMCLPHIASWSVSYSGDLGAKIATANSIETMGVYDPKAKRRDGKKGGAMVIKLSEGDFVLDVYEMKPGEGFTTDNSPIAAQLSNFMNDLKAVPGLNPTWIDNKYDGLRNLVINEAEREMAAPDGCGHVAIGDLTHPTNVDVDAQSAHPQTIQGLIIHNDVAEANSILAGAKSNVRLTSYDFDVEFTPSSVQLPTEYTQFSDAVHAHPPKNTHLPGESSIHTCKNLPGMGA